MYVQAFTEYTVKKKKKQKTASNSPHCYEPQKVTERKQELDFHGVPLTT